MIKLIEQLCNINGPSGAEDKVCEFILEQIKDYADITVTPLGSIIARKKCGAKPQKNIMIDAHMDEVGIIITSVTADGFAHFNCVGGIEANIMASTKVDVNGVLGVVMTKPVHFLGKDELSKPVSASDLYIDFGTSSKEETLKLVKLGDIGVICGEFAQLGDCIRAKALDDRVGVALLIDMLKDDILPIFTASFSVGEETGQSGAKTSTFIVEPDGAIVLEGTTALDVADVEPAKQVCALGSGPVVSFMDRLTLYDRKLYDFAMNSGVACQTKTVVAGGNNSGVIHTSCKGVPTVAISVPCRYIHSPSSVCNTKDIYGARTLAAKMLENMANGDLL